MVDAVVLPRTDLTMWTTQVTTGMRLCLVVDGAEIAAEVRSVDDPSGLTFTASTADLARFTRPVDGHVEWPLAGGGVAVASASIRRDGPVLTVTLPAPAEHVQRRNFFRVPVVAPVELRSQSGQWTPGTLIDLSEGGARLRFTTTLPTVPGNSSHVRLNLDADAPVVLPATVLRVAQVREDMVFEVVLTFDRLTEQLARQVRQFLFARQRDLRARGLL